MDPFNLQNTNWKDINPLAARVAKFVGENTQWVIYLRKDKRFPCPTCWDPSSKTADHGRVDCEDGCWGTGVKTTLQLAPCRMVPGTPNNLLEGDLRLGPGYVERNQVMGIFPREVYPQMEDIILAAEWTTPTQKLGSPPRSRPVRISDVFIIKNTASHFEREFGWTTCSLELYTIDAKAFTDNIYRMVNIEIIKRDKSTELKTYW